MFHIDLGEINFLCILANNTKMSLRNIVDNFTQVFVVYL